MKKFIGLLLAICMCIFCVACAPADMSEAKGKMEEAGYTVTVLGETATELFAGPAAIGKLTARKIAEGDYDSIEAILFENSTAAMNYYEEEKNDVKDGKTCKQEGNWVIIGTDAAIEAFTK